MIKSVLFKTLSSDKQPVHGGAGSFVFQEWMPDVDPIPCQQGYHVCRAEDLLDWLAPRVFVAETRGKVMESHYKLTCESIKLVKELPFNLDVFINWCLVRAGPSSIPDGCDPSDPDELIIFGNIENNQQLLCYGLALQARHHSDEAAAQVTPKRCAQAVAWRAYQGRIDLAWLETGGQAPPDYWKCVEVEASRAKAEAHDAERAVQLDTLLRLLHLDTTNGR